MVASGLAVVSSPDTLDSALEARIKKALAECADEARSHIMLKHFPDRKDKGPTREECNQRVKDDQGNTLTRAMQLGNEQHEVALICAEERLRKLKPGGFSLKPRCQRDPQTGRWKHIPDKNVEDLLRQNKGAELRGSIEPDVVLHLGRPHQVQAVFDFKFPCVNGGQPQWRKYPEGPPHDGRTQGDLYLDALGVPPMRIIPRLGVVR